jgi:hypothetical protein
MGHQSWPEYAHLTENPHSRPLRVLEWGTLSKAIPLEWMGYPGHSPLAPSGLWYPCGVPHMEEFL